MPIAKVEVIQRVFRVDVRPPGETMKNITVDQPQAVKAVFVGTQGPQGIPGAQGPQGLPGSAADLIADEVPTGTINGSNATFTTAHNFLPASIEVSINGIAQRRGMDYTTIGTNTIHFTDSPESGDFISVDYQKG